tara:strand:- start:3234 stop:3347 length:114 start_codon:yes stop_codon:yes gene_type:complete
MDLKEKIKNANSRIKELEFLIKEWNKKLPKENNNDSN